MTRTIRRPEGGGTVSAPRVERDPRIDFVRGAALLTIHADHIRPNLLADFTPRNFGFIDMADVFVFLSGYVGGIAYGRVLDSRGLLACQRKSLLRASQLVLAYVITLLVLRLMGEAAWRVAGHAPDWIPAMTPGTSLLQRALGHVFEVDHAAGILDILSLYVWLLLALPLLLWIGRRNLGVMVGASLAVYAAVQLLPGTFDRALDWRSLSGFNPFAWQFLFFLAVALGSEGGRARARARAVFSADRTGVLLALVVLETAFLLRIGHRQGSLPGTDKGDLGPFRVVNLFALLTLGRRWLPSRGSGFWTSALIRPVVLCGQNPLVAFSAGAILATLASQFLVESGGGPLREIAATVAVWLGSVLAARFGRDVRREARRLHARVPALAGWCARLGGPRWTSG